MVLEHLLVQEQLGNHLLESIHLELQLAPSAIGIDLVRSAFSIASDDTWTE